jgi:hypothetical protein
MATDSLHRHIRRCVDAATSRVFVQLRQRHHWRDAFSRLLIVAHERSDLMRGRPPASTDALTALAQIERAWLREPEDWAGARGHPLAVVHSLADHLFGPYPTPRFLASAWFGGTTQDALRRRQWVIAHGRGKRFRDLELPLAMTRRMEHVFLKTPDHVPIDHALRRAEIVGLGGSLQLADALCATRLVRGFDDATHWRRAIEWFVRVEDELDLAQVGPIVDYVHAMRGRELPRGRTVASMMREVGSWHAMLAATRAPWWRLCWPRSRWAELRLPIERARDDAAADERRAEWHLVEVLDSSQLSAEGRAMHHCVATYARRCFQGGTAIWSLRQVAKDGTTRGPFLTIEIETRTGTIVQVKGPSNTRASGRPLAVLRIWAARERLAFSAWVLREITGTPA